MASCHRLCSIAAAILLAACAGQRPMPGNQNSLSTAQQRHSTKGEFLYVADWNRRDGRVASVYSTESSKLARFIILPFSGPCGFVFDPSYNLAIGDGGVDVYVYARGSTKLLQTLATDSPLHCALAFDSKANLYVANTVTYTYTEGSVSIFGSGHSSPTGTIAKGIDRPYCLLVDASDDLYVANVGNNSITVYASGASTPMRTITQGIETPHALWIDASGNLYVANGGKWDNSHFVGSSVSVYTETGSQPSRVITDQVDAPDAVVTDASGNLFVANKPPLVRAAVRLPFTIRDRRGFRGRSPKASTSPRHLLLMAAAIFTSPISTVSSSARSPCICLGNRCRFARLLLTSKGPWPWRLRRTSGILPCAYEDWRHSLV